jgi:hypothetical protein
MTEKTEPTELKTFQIGEKTYDAASITEQGVNIINDIRKVDNMLSQQQLQVSITQLAKTKLMEELEKEKENFTEVTAEAAETPAE